MSFGPGKLLPLHRAIIKQYKLEVSRFNKGELEWSSKELESLKKGIRLSLREQQDMRCVFCRRIIKTERRNATEDIEHFLDKSKSFYRKWAFSPVNLAIACHPCNMQKSTRDMGDAAIASARGLTADAGNYKWLHPYFDDYYENIEIHKGWVYTIKHKAPQADRARKMIKDCMLDCIQTIEKRSVSRTDRLARLHDLAFRSYKANRQERAEKLMLVSRNLLGSAWMDI